MAGEPSLVLDWLKNGQKPGVDFLLIDWRRTDPRSKSFPAVLLQMLTVLESECEIEMVHPLFRRREKNPTKRTGHFAEMRDKNPARRTGDLSDLPFRSIRSYKPTLKAAASHYTGETLKSYTPSIRNREPQVQEQQEVTLGLDRGTPNTPTPASRSVSNRPWLTVDVIPEAQGKISLPYARNG
ncbi:hypothetical protein H2202_011001 [Exophiala xenobiotica]|nr:hypothetical protein H2202_011001 [Exophiala xenobiotica]